MMNPRAISSSAIAWRTRSAGRRRRDASSVLQHHDRIADLIVSTIQQCGKVFGGHDDVVDPRLQQFHALPDILQDINHSQEGSDWHDLGAVEVIALPVAPIRSFPAGELVNAAPVQKATAPSMVETGLL
jgi:hypothetical protein